MEEGDEKILYIQDGVVLKTSISNDTALCGLTGSLSIVEHPHYQISIDWKPNFVMYESVHEKEWTVVDPATEKPDNYPYGSKLLRIKLEDLDKIINKNKIIQLTGKNGCSAKFYFQHGNADTFSRNVNLHCETKAINKNSLQVVKANVNQVPNFSLADIEMFDDVEYHSWNSVGTMVRNLKDRPISTVLGAGTRVLDALFGIPNYYMEATTPPEGTYTKNSDEYEVINKDQILPPVGNITRGPALTESQWKSFQDDSGRIAAVNEIKDIIFRGGIDPSIRAEVWKYLLHYHPWKLSNEERKIWIKEKENEYCTMKAQWKTMTAIQESRFIDYHERKNLVEKDVNRTDRAFSYYAGDNNPNVAKLYDILLTYVMYNFDLGYVQGMSDLLSPILYLTNDEVEAFWCFVGFMDRVYTNFDIDQAGMKHQLQQLFDLLSFVNPELTKHLSKNESANMYFCFRWLLVLFKREFTLNDIMRLWEVLWSDRPCKNFHLLICIAILDNEKSTIIEKEYDFCKILKHVNELSMKINLDFMLTKAEGIYCQLVNAKRLPNKIRSILGMELLSPKSSAGNSENSSPEASNKSLKPEGSVYMEVDRDEVSFQQSLELNHL